MILIDRDLCFPGNYCFLIVFDGSIGNLPLIKAIFIYFKLNHSKFKDDHDGIKDVHD